VKSHNSYLPDGLSAPRPEPDGLSRPYWEGLQREELWVQHCTHCGGWQWGPEYLCHRCHRFDLGWERIEPQGRIYSWERPWHPVHPALRQRGPYLIVLVELPQAGNIRMVGNLLGAPLQSVSIGTPVEGVFEHHGEGDERYTLLQWRVAAS
jgi:uncharacterized OB-fold protein